MVKVLSCSFAQCFGPFPMLLVEVSSETRLCRHLSNHVFPSPSIQKYISYEGHLFFWIFSKLSLNLENATKNPKKFFVAEIIASENVAINCLSYKENTYYQQSMGLKNGPKILHITQWNSLSARFPCCLSKGPLKWDFLDTYLTMFFGVSKFKNTWVDWVTVFWKCSKLNLNLENANRIQKIFFVSEKIASENVAINCFLLQREYLLSAVNGLTKSPKVLHITQRDFLNLNCLHRDQ